MQPKNPSDVPSLPQSQRPKAPPGPRIKNLAETVWTKLDRKATAIHYSTVSQEALDMDRRVRRCDSHCSSITILH